MKPARLVPLIALLGITAIPSLGQTAPTMNKVILDTDIGDDVDDAYALALLVNLKNAKILGITTAFGETRKRAEVAAKLLQRLGRPDIPVFAGRAGEHKIGRQYEWAKGFKSKSIHTEPAIEFMKREIEKAPGRVTLIAVGPETNLGDLLTKYPEVKTKIKAIVIMGGAVHRNPPIDEWNIKCDVLAAKVVFTSGVPIVMAGLEVTEMMKLDPERQKKLFGAGTPATDALAALTNLWGGSVPVLYDPVAVAQALGFSFCSMERQHVAIEDGAVTRITTGEPNTTVLTNARKDDFLDWIVGVLSESNRQDAKIAK